MNAEPCKAAAIALAIALGASILLLVHPWFDITNDGSIYIATARSLLAGDGYTYNGVPFQVRPPGFSLFLAPLLAAFGSSFVALNAAIHLVGATGIVLLFHYARRRMDWRLALGLAVVVWMTPIYRRLCNQVMSDVPGVTLLFACLALEAWARRAPSWVRDGVVGVAVGLSAYVRSTSILLVPAILIARFLGTSSRREERGRAWRGAAVTIAAALLTLAPWIVRTSVNPAPVPATQTRHYSYATHTWHEDTGDPSSPRLEIGEIAGRIPGHAELATRLMGIGLDGDGGTHAALAFGLLLLGALAFVLVKEREAPELYAAALLAVALVSRDFLPRHLLPIFVVALLDLVIVARTLGERIRAGAGTPLAGLPLAALLVLDWEPRPAWETIETTHGVYAELCGAAADRLDENARLGAPYGFVYAVYLERPVVNLGFVVERAGDVRALEEEIDARGVDTVVLSPRLGRDAPFVPYFAARYGAQPRDGVITVRVR